MRLTAYRARALLLLAAVTGAACAASETSLPLQPARTVRFETDQGTWMSVDVSPDGRTLVFDLLGDLYTLPVQGGRATRITSGLPFDSQPRFSPDGSKLVFVSDRDGSDNLWIADAGGGQARAITGEQDTAFISPEWTPDGRAIVVSRASGIAGRSDWASAGEVPLYLYSLAGGTGLKVSGGTWLAIARTPGSGGGRYLGATFAPDGELFAAANRAGMGNGSWQIVSFDRETARPRFRTGEGSRSRTGASGSAMRPAISPDGRHLVYATRMDERTELRIQDLSTGSTRTLVPEATRDAQREGAYDASRDLMPGAAFVPDGSALIASYGGKLWRVEVTSGAATPIPFTASVEQELGPLVKFESPLDDDVFTVRQIRHARPSPDGKQLVFTAMDRLWIKSLPDGSARRLTQDEAGEYFPTWSPDGRYVAYATWRDDEGGHILRIRAEGGGKPQRLTSDGAYYEKLVYTPDGRHLLAARSPREAKSESRLQRPGNELRRLPNTYLVSLPAEGGETTPILPLTNARSVTPTFRGAPHFSAEPKRIYLYDPRDGLMSMNFDGSDRRAILKVTGFGRSGTGFGQVPADDVILSPDGRYALATLDECIYLIAVPAWGQVTVPTISVDSPESAAVPMTRLTTVGGDFAGWDAAGRSAYYSLGHAFFQWTVEDALLQEPASRRSREAERAVRRIDVKINVARQDAPAPVVLRGARLITMNKNDEVIDDGDLVIAGSHIVAVGARGAVDVPAEARVLDMSGRTILPGFIDTYAEVSPLWGSHEAKPWEYRVNLAYGVTTLREAQSVTTDSLSYADRLEAGEISGPRVLPGGRVISAEMRLRSFDEVRALLRRHAEFEQTPIVRQRLLADRRASQWFAMASRELGLTPTADGGGDLKRALTLAADGYAGLDGAIRTFPLYKDVTQFLARSGTTYHLASLLTQADYFYRQYNVRDESTLMRFTPWAELEARPFRGRAASSGDEYTFPQKARDAAKFANEGGVLTVGSHGVLQGLGYHWELWAMGSGGMSAHDVLRAATAAGASTLGWQETLGSLESGKLADLQVLDGNPLMDITQTNTIRFVMKQGRLYEAASLRSVWPQEQGGAP